ncbi:hypothetical protein FRC02_003972 [Tulasnella sp. 418]|nr:hypothetical protein FRC02_003972 [Tulasnella sp. 418]
MAQQALLLSGPMLIAKVNAVLSAKLGDPDAHVGDNWVGQFRACNPKLKHQAKPVC